MLKEGTEREVTDASMQVWVLECYTLREAAKAIGKTHLTLRRWIAEGVVPSMVLADTTFNYRQFSRGEINAMARVLAEHEQEYAYLRKEHQRTIERIFSAVNNYRQRKGIN